MGIKQESFIINTQDWTLYLHWSDKKVKTKNCHGCFEVNSVFWTSVNFFSTCHVLKTWFEYQE